MKLRAILALFLLVACSPRTDAWIHGSAFAPASNGNVLMGLAIPQYYNNINPFINWWYIGDTLRIFRSVGGNLSGQAAWDSGLLDLNTGELVSPATNVTAINKGIFTTPTVGTTFEAQNVTTMGSGGTPWYFGKVWHITWTGRSDTQSTTGTLGTGGSIVHTGANSATMTFGSCSPLPCSSGIANVTVQFSVDDVNDPPRNIKVYFAEYDANVARGELFDPKYINLLKGCDSAGAICTRPLKVIRFMDWMFTNGNFVTDYSQLPDRTYTFLTKPFCNVTGGICFQPSGSNGDWGPKGGIAPSVAVALANATGADPHYNIPFGLTDAAMTQVATYFRDNLNPALKVRFEYCNENWNTGGAFNCFFYMNAQVYPGTGTTGQAAKYAGYRAAQLYKIVSDVYGVSLRSRWSGEVGSQAAAPSEFQSGALVGINYYLNNVAPPGTVITDLFDAVLVAPYVGQFFSGKIVTNVTAANPGVVTTSTAHGFSNGDVKRIFLSAGTMGTFLNNTDVTVTVVDGTHFSIGVDTTGKVYAAGTNYVEDAAMFDAMDTSAANHVSDPVTYPTNYTYFAQQLSKSITTGASDVQSPSGKTITQTASFVTTAANFTAGSQSCSPSCNLAANMAIHQLQANSVGLQLRQYEGGPNWIPSSGDTSILTNSQFIDYWVNYLFDPAATGITAVYQSLFQMQNNVFSGQPARYTDFQWGSPWMSYRFFEDTSNPQWQAILAQNALGPYVEPANPHGTCAYTGVSGASSGSGHPGGDITLSVPGLSGGALLVIPVTTTGGTITSVIDTTASVTLTLDKTVTSGATSAIFSGVIPASGTDTHSVTVTYNADAQFKRTYAIKCTGMTSNTVVATASGGGASAIVAQTRGDQIIAVGDALGGGTDWTATNGSGLTPSIFQSSTPVLPGASPASRSTMAIIQSPFSSSIFSVNKTTAGPLAVATYH